MGSEVGANALHEVVTQTSVVQKSEALMLLLTVLFYSTRLSKGTL